MPTNRRGERPKIDKFIRKQCVTDAPPYSLKELHTHHTRWADTHDGVTPVPLWQLRSELEDRGYRIDEGRVVSHGVVRDKIVRVHGLAHKSAARSSSVTEFLGLRTMRWPGGLVSAQDLWLSYKGWATAANRQPLGRDDFIDGLRASGLTVERIGYASTAEGTHKNVLMVRELACPGLRQEVAAADTRAAMIGWIRETVEPGDLSCRIPVKALWEAYRQVALTDEGRAGSRQQFIAALRDAGYQVRKLTYIKDPDGVVTRNADAVIGARYCHNG